MSRLVIVLREKDDRSCLAKLFTKLIVKLGLFVGSSLLGLSQSVTRLLLSSGTFLAWGLDLVLLGQNVCCRDNGGIKLLMMVKFIYRLVGLNPRNVISERVSIGGC